MGGKKWRKMMAPFYCFEPNEPQDWLPDEACYFCNNSIKHDFVSIFLSINYLEKKENVFLLFLGYQEQKFQGYIFRVCEDLYL